MLGHAHLAETAYPAAIERFTAALQINPQLPTAHYGLATAYHKQGQNEQAIAECRKELALQADEAETNWLLGSLLELRGEMDEASKHLQIAVAQRADFASAWYLLGNIAARQNRLPEAEKFAAKAVQFDDTMEGHHLLLAQILQRQGKKTQAQAEFEKVKKILQQKRAKDTDFLNRISK